MSITNNYSSSYGDVLETGGVLSGFLGGMLIILIISMIISLSISIIMIISLFKIFKKNGKPGWYSLIPFLNMWTLFEISGNKGWLSLIPFVNVVFMYISNFKLSKKMGKSTAVSVVVVLFPFVGYPILAFSKDKASVEGDASNFGLNNAAYNSSAINNMQAVNNVGTQVFAPNQSNDIIYNNAPAQNVSQTIENGDTQVFAPNQSDDNL